MFNGGVRSTAELQRIIALPRRDPGAVPDGLAEEMTAILRHAPGSKALRRVQALALYEITACGGGLCSVEVGGGKTLISLLGAFCLAAERPMLLTPGGLVQKTNRDRADAENEGWLVPKNLRLFSYNMLSLKQWAAELEVYQPDLIIADEVQWLKSFDAACTKRVGRYLEAHPETKFIALSGTIMSKSILEFAHVLRWCLKDGCPLPTTESELLEWAAALDNDVNELDRYDPGALLELADAMGVLPDPDPLRRAREGFRRRLVETPGVITSFGRSAEAVDASIYIRAIDDYPVSAETLERFRALRADLLMPDGHELFEGTEVWRHARELAIGMTYVWNPWPPDEWYLPRRAWHSFVRAVVGNPGNEYDTEAQVVEACEAGHLPAGRVLLDAWRKVEPTFVPNVEPRWHDDGPMKACLEWMKERPGLVWTEHSFFGRRLAELAGTKYYGQKGLAADGEFVDDADNRKSIILSVDANRAGRNLQFKWARNLIVSPTESSEWWEQLIGRTHRTGQKADTVEVDVFLGCLEHAKAWRGARASARAVRETTGAEQKILIADIDDGWPSDDEIDARRDARWRVPPKTAFKIPSLAA